MDDLAKLEQESREGAEVAQFYNSPIFQGALNKIDESLESKALSIPTTDYDACADVVRCKQLMEILKRSFLEIIETGQLADASISFLRKEDSNKKIQR